MTSRKIVLIGGSAGSFRPVCHMLSELRKRLDFPLVLVLHRMKNGNTGFAEALSIPSPHMNIIEPDDKQSILPGHIYLAPSNYHLLIESTDQFALSTDETIQYSRPSIDATFESAAIAFGENTIAIILSGANRDGVTGAVQVEKYGGRVIVQDPAECEVPVMPVETLKQVRTAIIKKSHELAAWINQM